MTNPERPWRPVIFAADCAVCPDCDELECPLCEVHYADCDCPGPHQSDEFEYRPAPGPGGRLEARARE